MPKAVPTIYLAGGMRTVWRDKVKAAYPLAIYLDPTTSGLADEASYTAWDIQAIQNSDIFFGYLEKDNPSGYGLMLEIGVAFSYDVDVLLVDEKPEMRSYTGMARQLALDTLDNLDEGIDALGELLECFPCGKALNSI